MKTRSGVFLFLLLAILVLTTFAGRPAEASEEPNISPNPSELQPPKDYVPYTPTTQTSFWDQYGVITILAAILISTGIIVAVIQHSKNKNR